ncbi:Oxidoreductase andH [Lachnellula suecica]|uniref:Oxidoreductase andH n=1 Tax=Lachnellula suecica TaxID=602035 RepID=A0A8T9CEE7_9HELO|nr:Oxidoreductase andH [Lachnellula suecica]
MVSLDAIRASNKRITSALPPGLVAVFAGGTSGIGETSLKQFVQNANQPRVYFIGRSQEAGDRITAELKVINSGGTYTFTKSDTSLLANVDEVCREIKSKEPVINLLFLTIGALIFGTGSQKQKKAFITPCRSSPSLRRVVTVLAGGKEGQIFQDDFQGRKVPMASGRGHSAAMTTLSLEIMAQKAPNVSFLHVYPGFVKTGISRGSTGALMTAMKVVSAVVSPFLSIPFVECGERHVFLATSARFPPSEGVPMGTGVGVAVGSDGESGSVVYPVNYEGEVAGPKVLKVLADARRDGIPEKLWEHTEEEFVRITGQVAI